MNDKQRHDVGKTYESKPFKAKIIASIISKNISKFLDKKFYSRKDLGTL